MRAAVWLGFIVLVGCGGMEGDGAYAQDSFGMAEQAASTTYRYRCRCIPATGSYCTPTGDWGTINIALSTTRATTSIGPAGSHLTYGSTPSTGANAGYSRYTGPGQNGNATLVVEKALRTSGGYTLRTGGKGGYAKYWERTVDGYAKVKYICRR